MKAMICLQTAFICGLLAACGSAPTRIHTLEPRAGHRAPIVYDGPAIRVAAVHFPPDIDRLELVTESANGELKISDGDHWAAPLSKLAQQTLTADLLSRLPPDKVVFPRLPISGTPAELRVDVLKMAAGGSADLVASWQLEVDNPRRQTSGVIHLQGGTDLGSAESVVNHLSTILAQIADGVVAVLPTPNAPVPQ